MSTLAQLAGGSQAQGVSTAVTQVSGITPTKEVVGESLSQDLLGIIKPAANITQTYFEESNKAAQRSAVDSLTQMSKDLNSVEAMRTPETDEREIIKANEAIFQFYGDKKFKNEEAQQTFDSIYKETGIKTISNKRTALSKQANQKDADRLVVSISQSVEEQLSAGVVLDSSMLKSYVEAATSGGYYSAEDVQYTIADRTTTAFSSRLTKNTNEVLLEAGHNLTDTVSSETLSNVFANAFGGFGKFNNKTNAIEWNEGVENKAKEEILRSWGVFESAVRPEGGSVIDPFKQLKSSVTNRNSSAKSNYLPSAILAKQFSKDLMLAGTISNTKPSTASQQYNMRIEMEDAKNTLTLMQTVEADLGFGGAIDTDAVRGFLNDGKSYTSLDVGINEKRTTKIPPSVYQAAAKYYVDTTSKNLLGMDMNNPENASAFRQGLVQLKKFENASKMTSALTTKYDGVTESGKVQTFKSNETRQLIEYNKTMLLWDKNNEVLREATSDLEEIVTDQSLTPEQKDANVNISIQTFKNNNSADMQRSDIRSMIATTMSKERSGVDFFTNESVIDKMTERSIMQDIYKQKKQNVAEDYVNTLMSTRSSDIGSTMFGDKDQRYIRPNGMSDKESKKAINAILKDFKKKTYRHYDEEDVTIKNDFKNGDYTIKVYSKFNGDFMGEIEAADTDILVTKE